MTTSSEAAGVDAPGSRPTQTTTPEPDIRTDMRAMLRSVGINVTEEGMARFRKRLREAEAKWTPEARAALLEQLGLGWRGRTSDRADMDAPNHFPSRMTLLEPDRHADADAVLRAAGINVTEQGKARWRVLLREAAAKHTPEARAKWRAQAGLPTESA